MTTPPRHTRRLRQGVIAFIVLIIVGLSGLALDLYAHGLIWRTLYTLTGEESPAKQLVGALEYAGNFTRTQPNPIPVTNTPIQYTAATLNPLGVNTFLEDEVEPAKRDKQMQMIQAAGFAWIRQQFRWDDLEISGRGNFTDARNRTPISAWAKYDNIVDLADRYKVQIIARLNSPPAWSQSKDNAVPGRSPPADVNDFVNYATAVAARYKGRITFFQVWNEPNIYPEWGNASINPEAYTDLLCRTYKALKAVDPSIVVISAALAATNPLDSTNLNDLVFLQRMYDAGAARCFDILGAQGYGLFSGPTDQRMRLTDLTFARNVWLRDIMLANGDATKPIWIGEMGWNPVPDDPTIASRDEYGQVTDAQAARYAVEAYQRARQDWPWIGVISVWYFKRADDSIKNQNWYYFRLVDPDFTPRPVYTALSQYAHSLPATANPP